MKNRHGRACKCLGGASAAPHDAKRMEEARKEVKEANKVERERAARRRVQNATRFHRAA